MSFTIPLADLLGGNDMATKSLAQARSQANSIVNGWTAGAALIGLVPGSSLVLGAADIKMVHDVAKAYEVQHYNIEEITTAVAATIAGRFAADGLLSFIPVAGWIVKAGIAATVTQAAGRIVIEYFESRSDLG